MSPEQAQMWGILTRSPEWILSQLNTLGVDVKRLNRMISRRDNPSWHHRLADSLQVMAGYEGITEEAQAFCSYYNLFTPVNLGQER